MCLTPGACLLARRTKWSKSAQPTTVDVVTLGDVWLDRGIREGLLQPIPDAKQYRWWVSIIIRLAAD